MVIAAIALHNLNDTDLIECCLTKTPGAFNTLTRRYLKQVYSYIFHYVNNTELAEDLTQETFLRVYRSIGSFDRSRPFKPWLFTIATNASKSAVKRSQHNELLLNEDASEISLLDNLEDPHLMDDNVSDEAVRIVLYEALQKLSPPVRQAIILRHVHDLPYEEVAKVMHANINTVRTWLKRGRENLKTILEHHGGLN